MFVTGDCSHGNEAAVVCAPPEGQCDFHNVVANAPECFGPYIRGTERFGTNKMCVRAFKVDAAGSHAIF